MSSTNPDQPTGGEAGPDEAGAGGARPGEAAGGAGPAGAPAPEGWFAALAAGDRATSPGRTVTEAFTTLMTTLSGYTHPLFTDATWPGRAVLGGVPLPGGALVGLMGGLAEQSGLFDGAPVVLAGFQDVRFRHPVLVGDTIWVDVVVVAKETSSSGQGRVEVDWTARNQHGNQVASVRARFAVIG